MHDQSEFQCDPFQDRPAEKGGQEWVELEARRSMEADGWRSVRLFSQHGGDVSSLPSESHVFVAVCSQVARYAL